MTPDEARKGCTCEPGRWECAYHAGWKDGYEAAQREQIAAAMASLPRNANGLYYGADADMPQSRSEEPQGRPGR